MILTYAALTVAATVAVLALDLFIYHTDTRTPSQRFYNSRPLTYYIVRCFVKVD